MATAFSDTIASHPAHVPEELVRDVDYTNLIQGDEDAQEAWKRVQQTSPEIFWTPRNGGHWVVTRASLIEEIQEDFERFSHRFVTAPPTPVEFPMLISMDPPEHTEMRKVIMPALNKTALQNLEDEARKAAREIVAEIAPRGECEFVSEFSNVLPIVVFLGMMGLPLEDREMLLPVAETCLRGPTLDARLDAHKVLNAYVRKWVEERRAKPGTDLISRVAHSQVGDREITFEETMGMCVMLMLGGLDTVAGMLGYVTRYLAMHPEARHRLIDDPEIMPSAIEELIRRHGLANTSRYITRDMDFHGVKLKEGEMIQVPNVLYGLDDALHDDPLTVNFDRPTPIRHAAFGNGVHICPGGILARREIKVFLQEWLARIPDFAIKPGTKPKMATGAVNTVHELHLVWEPK